MRRNANILAAMALASAGFGVSIASPAIEERPRRVTRARANGLPHGFTPAWMNRHTGLPHEHKREIARRLRQNA